VRGALFLALAIAPALSAQADSTLRATRHEEVTRVVPNDNRTPAGALRNGILSLSLDVLLATWYPEAEDGPSVVVPVFAEPGRAPRIPGPLIRVPAGTTLDVTIRNALPDSTVTVFGLMPRPADGLDSLRLRPGESRTVRFAAGAPGTYVYWARVGVPSDSVERDQVGGAFVVDSAGPRPDDRVFVINIWGEPVGKDYRNAVAINGKSWPYTERLSYTVGDSVRWRWVNANGRNHPMHLHGFYFRVDSHGSPTADSVYAPGARRLAVTEELSPGQTMSIVWNPVRPGNWLFHCHIAFHVVAEAARLVLQDHGEHDGPSMAGLVLGIDVRAPPGWRAPERPSPRRLRFVVSELPRHADTLRTVGVAIGEAEAAPPAPRSPGPVLVVTRGQPTDVTVVNHLDEATAIHWHGLELESYSDGVAGWSGGPSSPAGRVAPAIAPGDSFTAHLTLRRAGTFIYHTHTHDLSQLTAGLYGPIVVLEPGERFDPATDHVFVIGWDGMFNPPHVVVDGDTTAAPLDLAAGRVHRFRFVNIGPAQKVLVSVRRDSTPAPWRPIAKDGAALPPAQAGSRPARMMLRVGETFDAAVTPEPGDYSLVVALPAGQPVYRRLLRVR
jgi:FtsP/CotA-like multicopper oxidase with cupredoxin domain